MAAPFDVHQLFAVSTVQAGSGVISSGSGTTIVLAASGDLPDPASDAYNIVVCPASTAPTTTNAEVMRGASKSGATLTVTRAQEGTAALTGITAGYQVFMAVTPKSITDIEAFLPGGVSVSRKVIANATVIPANFSAFVADSVEISSGITLELAAGAAMEIG